MKEEKSKSFDELMMYHLCRDLKMFSEQARNAQTANVSSGRAIVNMRDLLASTLVEIKELERKGIKRVEVKDDEKDMAKDPARPVPPGAGQR